MNRSSGAFTRVIWSDFAVVIKTTEGYFESVETAPSRRTAIGMAFRKSGNGKVMMCKSQDEMTRDERGRYDMETCADRVCDARENARRSMEFSHFADLH